MSAKETVNRLLNRMTGYHLTKGEPGASTAEVRQLRQQLAAARSQVASRPPPTKRPAKKATPAKKGAPGPGYPRDYDQQAREIITACRAFTMTSNEKLFALITTVRYITRYEIPGEIVECGVWRGGSMHAAARALSAVGDLGRELYLFDTFEGMPPPSDLDVRADGKAAQVLLDTQDRSTNIWAIATLDDVQKGFHHVPYPKERIHYVPGKVEDTVPGELPERISILRLDTDWYESTDHELKTAYDRLVPGGVLMIDDYGHWAGSKKATDEFLARTGERMLLHRMSEGRLGVKPWR